MQPVADASLLFLVAMSALQLNAIAATDLDEALFPKVGKAKPSSMEKDPACYVQPQWNICKYHVVKWQREYRWRAYYDQADNECYYFRGCPETNKDLFDFDVECREVCVHKPKTLQGRQRCSKQPRISKKQDCKTIKTKKAYFDKASSKCKQFVGCEEENKGFWNSTRACEADCVGGDLKKRAKKRLKVSPFSSIIG